MADAAALLQVSTSTIHNWIKHDAIPYIELPRVGDDQRAEYRIPLRGLIASLHGNYDLTRELESKARLLPPQHMSSPASLVAAVQQDLIERRGRHNGRWERGFVDRLTVRGGVRPDR